MLNTLVKALEAAEPSENVNNIHEAIGNLNIKRNGQNGKFVEGVDWDVKDASINSDLIMALRKLWNVRYSGNILKEFNGEIPYMKKLDNILSIYSTNLYGEDLTSLSFNVLKANPCDNDINQKNNFPMMKRVYKWLGIRNKSDNFLKDLYNEDLKMIFLEIVKSETMKT